MSSPADQKWSEENYAGRLAAEISTFRDMLDFHELPEIFHYWSNRYVKPKLEAFGFSSPDEMFHVYAGRVCASAPREVRLLSLCSGNCELEIQIAQRLAANAATRFTLECLDVNETMLARGRSEAERAGVADYLRFTQADVNTWTPTHKYDLVMCNQALHHMVNLEGLFAAVHSCLEPGGILVVSDMIGRNGHQRWPEALRRVHELWTKLPPSYRFNHKTSRYEERFENYDFSETGFEGVRAQDILPLLRRHFHFDLFIAFANIIDPFVSPNFGYNFEVNSDWDRAFIDAIHARDEEEICSGRVKPTHMLAVLSSDGSAATLCHDPLTPEFCTRDTSACGDEAPLPAEPYDWPAYRGREERELRIACERLRLNAEVIQQLRNEHRERTLWALGLNSEIDRGRDRIAQLEAQVANYVEWVARLEQEVQQRDALIVQQAAQIQGLEHDLEERSDWAHGLERHSHALVGEIARLNQERTALQADLESRTAWAQNLDQQVHRLEAEFEERSTWALQLDRDRQAGLDRIATMEQELSLLNWARPLDRRFHRLLDGGFRVLRRLLPV